MRLVMVILLLASLGACTQLPFCKSCQAEADVNEPEKKPWYRVPADKQVDSMLGSQSLLLSSWPQSQKRLKHYAQQLAYELTASEQLAGQRVVISSFVDLTEGLDQTHPLGNQLSEILRTLLPHYGVLVVEHKLTNALRVGPQGDFALSRDTRKLARQLPMDAILTGTMITTERGMEIHARVVAIDTQQISGSASGFIPHTVLNQIRP